MQKFDSEMLKRNIKSLMKNSDIHQQELADAIGMSQPNISKALNENDKKCFTVEQIFSIADYFGVSIDQLVGHNAAKKASQGQRAVGEFIAGLLADGTAKMTEVEIQEEVFNPIYDSNGFRKSRLFPKIKYPALYFSNYWNPRDLAKDDDELKDLFDEAEQVGNENQNAALNSFLEKYVKILKLYKDNQLPEEAYQIVLRDYLSKLNED